MIIGAGFSGLYQLYSLKKQGLSVKVIEAGSGVGALGTGIDIQEPGVIQKVLLIHIHLAKNCLKNGNGLKDTQVI